MGYETYLEKQDCHDCRAKPGELHDPGCDTEQCPECGRQAISCEHGKDVLYEDGELWEKRLPWTGVMSMIEEAVEYDLFVRWQGGRWVKCEKDNREAMPSRNDVLRHCLWDREKKRFVKP